MLMFVRTSLYYIYIYIYIYIRASVDALYRDGANVRGDAHMRKSFYAPRMCEYEPF